MERSETIGELATALAAAQAEIRNAARESVTTVGGGTKRPYADLASVWEACRGPLAANGLSICQTTRGTLSEFYLRTVLMHKSGEWIAGEFPLPAMQTGNAMQSMGSAITYARRYSLAAMVGVAPDDDDDGEAAGAVGQRSAQRGAPAGGCPSCHAPEGKPHASGCKGAAQRTAPAPAATPPTTPAAPPANPGWVWRDGLNAVQDLARSVGLDASTPAALNALVERIAPGIKPSGLTWPKLPPEGYQALCAAIRAHAAEADAGEDDPFAP